MKIKTITIILCAFCFFISNNSKAASFGRWNVDNLTTGTPFHNLWIKTNTTTSVTVHIICTRYMGETNFNLKFSLGTFENNANFYTGAGVHNYNTFTITAADFDNYSPGSIFLDYVKTITVDSRTQSLGNHEFCLFQYVSDIQGGILETYTTPVPIVYIAYNGTYDQFPSNFGSTTFNYTPGLSEAVPYTTITSSDTQSVLVAGQKIYSPNHKVYLTLQTDGNLVLRKINSDGTETSLWANGTQGRPSASLYLQTAGNLVIYPAGGTPINHAPNSAIWSSNIYSIAGLGTGTHIFYRLYDNGNLVGYWPNYLGYQGVVYIIADASDTDSSSNGRVSSHFNTLSHTLWSPAMQQASGNAFTPLPQ